MSADPFTLDGLPEVTPLALPAEVESSPIAAEAAEALRLQHEHAQARAELTRIAQRAPAARAADAQALAAAMAAGDADPEDPAVTELAAEVDAQRRRVRGLADAANGAHRALVAAFQEHAETWAAELRAEVVATSERVDVLCSELGDVLASTDAPRAALAWVLKGADPMRDARRGLPTSARSPRRDVILNTTSYDRDVLLGALRRVSIS